MLSSLSLENFKSWKSISRMSLAPITGLFGTNSSGKTSIIQLLLLLKQTVESPDRAQALNFDDDRSKNSLGTFRDTIYQHATPAVLNWSMSWTLPKPLKVMDPEQKNAVLFAGGEMGFSGEVTQNGTGRMVVTDMTYDFADRQFAMRRKGDTGEAYELVAQPEGDFSFRRAQGRP